MPRPFLKFCLNAALALGIFFGALSAQSAPPRTISYQGYLTGSAGVPVNGTLSMVFSLYNAASAGSLLWTETQDVTVASGHYAVVLGLNGGNPIDLTFDNPYYLGVRVGADAEMAPRGALTMVPYAFRALTADTATTATTFSGTIAGSQVVGPVSGEVPPGYMIVGSTSAAPPGYSLVGPVGATGFYAFAKDGFSPGAGQLILAGPSSLNVNEDATATFTVWLSQAPVAGVVVAVASGNTLAATLSPATLVFTPANYAVPQTVTVTGIHDANVVNNGATVSLTAAGIPSVSVAVTTIDVDVQTIVRSASIVSVIEGLTSSFTVRLAFAPESAVIVNVASGNPAAATAAAMTPPLEFNAANYATPQTVIVTGVQDADVANESVTLTLSAAGIPSATVTVNVTDDDTQAILVGTATLEVSESGSTTFNVSLQQAPLSNTTVTVISGNTAVATVSPATLNFSPGNYAVPQTVTVVGTHDSNLTNDVTTVILAAAGVLVDTVVDVFVVDTGP